MQLLPNLHEPATLGSQYLQGKGTTESPAGLALEDLPADDVFWKVSRGAEAYLEPAKPPLASRDPWLNLQLLPNLHEPATLGSQYLQGGETTESPAGLALERIFPP